MENRHTLQELKQWQKLPMNIKVAMTAERIRAWVQYFGEDGVYISFSGGKDSTVLLDIARNVCGFKKLPAVFVDVPTQYPDLRAFAERFDYTEIIKPKTSFMQVCDRYGFPMISKEVSGAVYEAKRYIQRITEDIDRQTDR